LRTEYVSLIDFSLFKDKWIDFGDSNGQRKGFQLANSDEDARNALQWKNDGSSKAPVIWNAAAKASDNEERDERKLPECHPSIQLRPLISPHL
jgi:hypothetical protein